MTLFPLLLTILLQTPKGKQKSTHLIILHLQLTPAERSAQQLWSN